MMIMLEVSGLSKYYGRKMAVKDISFSISQGEVVGLLGHNGSGKTTTMNMMTGYLAASSGTVRIAGADVQEEPFAARSQIGYLPENPPVYLDMTVDEQLFFAAGLKGIPKIRQAQAVATACAQLGVAGVRRRLISNLSKGYRQRVGFAQALLGEPRLLILDEPTVGLDPRQIIEVREVIRALSKNHTIILSSHILSEISAVCGRVIVLSNGRMAADDTPSGLIERFSQPGELELQAQGDPARILAALRELEELSSCELRTLDACPRFSLQAKEGTDPRPAVFYKLAELGCPILLLQPAQSSSLEDIFLRLTQDKRYEEEEA